MSYDGLVMHAVLNECKDKLLNGRVDKIYQHEKDEILIYFRANGQSQRLLLSASSNNPRCYLTTTKKENPIQPPMFSMVLRKHLVGSRLINIEQIKMDRVLKFDFLAKNELNDTTKKSLFIEVMGKHSNIILVDSANHQIIDSIKRVNVTMSSVREVLPGEKYDLSMLVVKKNPLEVEKSDFYNLLSETEKRNNGKKFLMNTFTGVSPLISREILFRSGIDENMPVSAWTSTQIELFSNSFFSLFKKIKNKEFSPTIIKDNDLIQAFSAIDLEQYSNYNHTSIVSISELLDRVYTEKDLSDRLQQKSQGLKKSIKTNLDRALKKQAKLTEEYQNSITREKYKVYGDLISANAHSIEKGLNKTTLQNFYSENLEDLVIPLDPKLSASANATKYYKKYSKLKHAANLLQEQLEKNKDSISYLENTLLQINLSETPRDLEEIQQQYRQDFQKKDSRKKKKTKEKSPSPITFETPSGAIILVGKNNRQNDYITFKEARKDDLWFHVKGHPGSHVILKKNTSSFENSDMLLAAGLAAYYSSLKDSPHVDVDYTLKKYIKRHPENHPGLVNYNNFKTVHINDQRGIFENLKRIR